MPGSVAGGLRLSPPAIWADAQEDTRCPRRSRPTRDQPSRTTSQDPSRLCAPAARWCQKPARRYQTQGKRSADTIPPPPITLGVYLGFCSSPVSLSLSFSWGVGAPGVQSAHPVPSHPGAVAPKERQSGGRPSPCSQHSMEVQSTASQLWEGRCWWMNRR
uniref:Uncharacterized protein n=1 Tax=Pipistrellus kuhlii TaxID=59472 RepID=A0A7J7XB65_PIPKU|nr:hypothetical protein mPipKuh1_010640 [Pipistrellus kuhlii]